MMLINKIEEKEKGKREKGKKGKREKEKRRIYQTPNIF